MTKIKKINKNYYRIKTEPVCSMLVSEKLMRKIMPVLYKYKNEIEALLENNKQEVIKEEWSFVHPKGELVPFFVTDGNPLTDIREPRFICEKVKNLYFIGEESIRDKNVQKEIEKLIELELEAEK